MGRERDRGKKGLKDEGREGAEGDLGQPELNGDPGGQSSQWDTPWHFDQ